ncbi:MAG: hypothetical protein J7L71_10350 [Spirochaetaceae bacterium]|nr:hypothetical protein [Spirochaetaceae bacterium]
MFGEKTQEITIESSKPAKIYINDKYIGQTPITSIFDKKSKNILTVEIGDWSKKYLLGSKTNGLYWADLGCTDEECQLEVGKLLAADYMVVGNLGKIGTRYAMSARLIDVETGETVLSVRDIYSNMDSMLDGCSDITNKLVF